MLSFKEFINLDEEVDEASIARVNRVRGGKIQRRKIVSMRPGYKIQNGKLVRMTSGEIRRRHFAQVKAARKRKPILTRILKRRAISLRKRQHSGIV